jgi:AcrR family transcriptional regulator
MVSKRQKTVLERKTPVQTRALNTREAIFEATARIIERDGAPSLNTNTVAERAGISIGTLYGHFPNKEAILIAMARRQLDDDRKAVSEAVAHALDTPGASVTRMAVHALVKLHRSRPDVRRAIMATHAAFGFGAEHAASVKIVVDEIAAHRARASEGPGPMPPVVLFVSTRAVLGVLRSAFEEHSPLLSSRELEDQLKDLIECYFAQVRSLSRMRD